MALAEKPRFELSATQVIGGALAAAGAAVAASMLGVYGTVIGSAVMSVVATVGTALYGHSVQRGKQTIHRVRHNRTTGEMRRIEEQADDMPAAEAGAATAETEVVTAETGSQSTEEAVTQDLSDEPTERLATGESGETGDAAGEPARPSLGDRLRALNWRTVSVTAAVVLVLGLGAVTLAELAMGQSVSSALGGGDGKHRVSVVSAFNGDGGGGSTGDRGHKHSPSPSATSSDASPTASTSSPDEAPSSAPDTTTETTTTDSTQESSTSEPTTAPTTAPPTSDPAEGGDTSQGLVPNQQATGDDAER